MPPKWLQPLGKRYSFQEETSAPARKASKGVTMQASGMINPTPSELDNESGSSQPIRVREVVPELSTPFSRQQIYARMMNDASVDVSMRVYKTPVLGAEYFVEPYSDDPLDLEIAEFCTDNLMGGMASPFLNSLEDILHMYEDGYAVLEKVYERREWSPKRAAANTRQFVMLKKLGVRPAATIKEIVYDDNGGPETLIQNAIRQDGTVEEVELEIAKALIFTFNRQGGDLTGKSLLRTAYSHWYYKTHMYKIDAIQKERFSLGVIKGRLLPGYKPADKPVLRQLLRNFRTNEESFMLLTPNVEVDIEFPPGTPVDVIGSANHHNTMILLNVLAQFIGLGATTEGGGRATAGTGADMMMKSLRYVANQIVQQINMYLIPELVVWNFPTTRFPQLQVRNIGETRDLQMFAAAIANLYGQDALTKGDTATENWLRKIFDAPAIAESAIAEQAAPVPATNGNGSGSKEAVAASVGKNPKGNAKGERTGFVGQPPNAAD